MKLKAIFFALCAASYGATMLHAEDFSTLVGQTVTLTVNPYSGENDGHFYVGLTTGSLSTDAQDLFNMFCVDFAGEISVPTTYNVVVRSLDPMNAQNMTNDPGNVDNNALGLTLFDLQTMAILGQEFGGTLANDIALQHDIWDFTGGTFATDQNLIDAEAAVPNTDFSNAYLLDVTAPTNQQGFETIMVGGLTTHAAPLPEPGTLFLLGAGLLAVGFTRRSR